MSIKTIRVLIRLRSRQFFRQKNKGLAGKIIIVVYFWFLELLLFFMLRKEGVTNFPPLLVAGICMGFIVPDFIIKLIFEHDQTVMDAFIRTRPISQSSWDRFLTVSQFWKSSNLAMPLIMAPVCFLFLRFPLCAFVLMLLYLFSVFGGFLVMLLKHRGNYQQEQIVSSLFIRSYRQHAGHHIFGIQSRSMMRSKRLKTSLFVLSGLFLFQFILQGLADVGRMADLFLFFLIYYTVFAISQFGLAVEANFFCGIWTKPISVSRLLSEKYLFSSLLGGLMVFVTIPFCLWFHIPLYVPLVYALFSSGVGELLALFDPFNCVPFDLFGKTFFNYQGASSTYKASTIFGQILVIAIPIVLPYILPDWVAYLILGILGLAGIFFHLPYFRWLERQFMKNRYKYMEKYLSI